MSSHDDSYLLDQYNQDVYQFRLYQRTLWERAREPSVLVPIIILLTTVIFSSTYASPPRLLALKIGLWDALVSVAPAKLLYAIDDWLNPNPFPRPMLLARPATHEAKSDILAKILGRDRPGGIVASVSYAGKTGFSKFLSKADPERPAGLGNLSNSCYQNSVLQGLASLRPMREYLAWIAEGDHELPRIHATEALGKLVKNLYSPSQNGQTFWTPPILKRMSTFQQQDAQEYFSKLLNEVQEEIEKALKAVQKRPGFEADVSRDETVDSQHSDDSGYQSISTFSKYLPERSVSFRLPLEGLIAQRVACTACGYSSGLSLNPFQCLTLSLDVDHPEYYLEETMDSYTEIEQIEGVQCAHCTLLKFRDRIRTMIENLRKTSGQEDEELKLACPSVFDRLESIEAALEDDDFEEVTLKVKCKIPEDQRVCSTKTKQVGIARPPPSLAFHINRSRFDEVTGFTYKNGAAVRFPMLLDLGPWCLGSAGSQVSVDLSETATINATQVEEQWQLPPQLPIVAGSQHRSKISGPFYELKAVITHYGRHENGHYVCYRKHPPPGWEAAGDKKEGKEDAPTKLAAEDSDGQDEVDGVDEKKPLLRDTDAEDVEKDQDNGSSWWRLSDQDVTRVDEETVLAQGGVFMLFYDRVDPNSVLVSDQTTGYWGHEEISTRGGHLGYLLSGDDNEDTPKILGQDHQPQGVDGRTEGYFDQFGAPQLSTEQIALLPGPVKAAMESLGQLEGDNGDSIHVTPDRAMAAARSPVQPTDPSIVVHPGEVKAAVKSDIQSSGLKVELDQDGDEVDNTSNSSLPPVHGNNVDQAVGESIDVRSNQPKAAVRSIVRPTESSVSVAADQVKAATRSVARATDRSIEVQSEQTRAAVEHEPMPWHSREDVLRYASLVPLPAEDDGFAG